MFIKYLEPIFRPWRTMRNKIVQARTVKGRFTADVNRVKRFGGVAKGYQQKAQGHVKTAQGQAQQVQGQAQLAHGQAAQVQGQAGAMHAPVQPQMPAQPQMPVQPQGMMQGAPMQPGQMQAGPMAVPAGAIHPNPPIKKVGFFRRRKVCTQCTSELDKTWDHCPYCAHAAAPPQPASGPQIPERKTQAFNVNAVGASVQLMGWLVPVKGPQRGELFTLAPHSIIGTDPNCQVVLADNYMSGQHAEIRAEGGLWVLKDLGSTNGTTVNDKRVDSHELVDNDFIKFGSSLCKFKSL